MTKESLEKLKNTPQYAIVANTDEIHLTLHVYYLFYGTLKDSGTESVFGYSDILVKKVGELLTNDEIRKTALDTWSGLAKLLKKGMADSRYPSIKITDVRPLIDKDLQLFKL